MRRRRSWVRVRRAVLVVAVAAAVTTATLVPAAAAAPAPPPPAQGSTAGASWDVRASDGSYVVRLTLPTAVPVRAAQPQLAVDGRVVGTATQDPDGRTLRVSTSDPRVASARRVELAWNGVVVGTRPAAPEPTVVPTPSGTVLAQDPATADYYRVQRADYDLGETAVRLPGLDGQAVELRAAVYLPSGARGPRPVVVFLHGRHQPCYSASTAGQPTQLAWPCGAGQLPVPSYLGYGQAALALAAAGYVVVSISADGINALDYATADGGAEARGELVLAHLDQLAAWNAGQGSAPQAQTLRGRLDLTDVGLMGHSRGGEGVVKAALLNAERPSPYGIRGVMPLAPVDFGRSTLPGVPMAVVLPYCDGDVSDQQGQHFYDDSRYAAGDDVLRTSLFVMGADHNYFNSQWTPGTSVAPAYDDWGVDDDPVCGPKAPSRLSAAEQRAVGAAYISGFFRLNLGGERQFLPLFDGTGGRAASAGRAVVYAEAQQPGTSRTDLASLRAPSSTVRTTAGAVYCAGAGDQVAGQLPPCVSSSRSTQTVPHWTPAVLAPSVPASPMVRLTWTTAAPAQAVTVAAGPVVGVRQALTFRAAPAGRTAADLLVTLADATGRRASVPVSRTGPALTPLPSLTGFSARPTPKTWLRTVRIPLADFGGVDLTRLASASFTSTGSAGDVFLSDVSLDTPAPGAGGPSALPVVSIGDAGALGSSKPTQVAMAVTLSRASAQSVTVQVQLAAVAPDDRLRPRAIAVTIPTGRTVVPVTFTLPGRSGPSRGQVEYENSVSVPTNAIVGDALGTLTVYPSG